MRSRLILVLSLLIAAPVLTVVGPAVALDRQRVGPVDRLQRGFPAYYTDDAGMALQLCDDGRASCLLARPRDLAPPEGEQLYWAAFAELSSPGIELSVEFALEAAWLGREQVVFDRLRVRGHVDRAGTYTLLHPYGQTTIEAESPVEDRNVDFTEDIGCEPLPGGRCRFRQAAGDPRAHITTWLRQTDAPRRYMGNPEDPSRVTGGRRQSVTVSGPAGVASTAQFAVLGKRANANAVSLRRRHSFGNVRTRPHRVLRLLNIGTGPMTIRRVRLRGERTIKRFRVSGACRRGDVLRVGDGCRLGIRYRPDGRKRSSARLVVTDDARTRRVRISAATAAVLSARRRVHFSARRADTRGPTRRIVVTNTGSLPMRIRGVGIAGRNAPSFERRSGSPRVCERGVRVPAGGRCGIYVGFEPTNFGSKRATITVRANALRAPQRIRLSGRAR